MVTQKNTQCFSTLFLFYKKTNIIRTLGIRTASTRAAWHNEAEERMMFSFAKDQISDDFLYQLADKLFQKMGKQPDQKLLPKN